jgi:hypothetical protein
LIATPAEFKTAAPPETPVKKAREGRVVGTVGSFKAGNTLSMTAIDPALGVIPMPPVEVKVAVSAPVFPLVETSTPRTSNELVDAAENVIPVVGVWPTGLFGVPKPITTCPPE